MKVINHKKYSSDSTLERVLEEISSRVSEAALEVTPHPVVLAGGAVRDLCLGMRPRDLDFFVTVPTSESLDDALVYLGVLLSRGLGDPHFCEKTGEGYAETLDPEFIVYERFGTPYPIQLIGRSADVFSTEDLVESFDYPLVQCYYADGVVHGTDAFEEGFENKTLDFPTEAAYTRGEGIPDRLDFPTGWRGTHPQPKKTTQAEYYKGLTTALWTRERARHYLGLHPLNERAQF